MYLRPFSHPNPDTNSSLHPCKADKNKMYKNTTNRSRNDTTTNYKLFLGDFFTPQNSQASFVLSSSTPSSFSEPFSATADTISGSSKRPPAAAASGPAGGSSWNDQPET